MIRISLLPIFIAGLLPRILRPSCKIKLVLDADLMSLTSALTEILF